MAIPDPPKAGSPFCALWTGGWNPNTPKLNNFCIPEITLRGGYACLGPIFPLGVEPTRLLSGTPAVFLEEIQRFENNQLYAPVLAAASPASPASTQLPHTWIPQVASGCSGTNRYGRAASPRDQAFCDFPAIYP